MIHHNPRISLIACAKRHMQNRLSHGFQELVGMTKQCVIKEGDAKEYGKPFYMLFVYIRRRYFRRFGFRIKTKAFRIPGFSGRLP